MFTFASVLSVVLAQSPSAPPPEPAPVPQATPADTVSTPQAPTTSVPTPPAPAPAPAPAVAPAPVPTPVAPAPVAPVVAPATPAPAIDAPAQTYPYGVVPGPLPPSPELTAQLYRKIVVATIGTLNFGLFPVPSGDFTLFLGTNLRPRRGKNFDWNTALGYQVTASVGYADFYFAWGLLTHRHHITAMGYGGKRQRFYYSFGGGAFFTSTQVLGIEAEGRLGYIFSKEQKRVKGIIGAQARLGAAFEAGFPLPQFGLFVGMMAF